MLYLVATPIGNMDDMTFRAIETLKSVDLIACEDTRTSRKLLDHFDIHTPVTSYHEFNKIDKAEYLLERLGAGENVAVITDAGLPGISDPGEELVAMCYERGLEVTTIPGACAAVTAITMSGQSSRRFSFEAFLPKDKKERARVLEEMSRDTRTLIVYEAPHHLKKTLVELRDALGGDRGITLCRELTKKFEEKDKTTIDGAIAEYEEREPRGEYVLVIEGKSKEAVVKEAQAAWEEMSLSEHLAYYTNQGMDKKTAMKEMAKDRGVSKRDIYNALLTEE
ncbi:MAG: 16S rRNA (cytidine(1402)-2'-O)-methyltransferase [Lachnospiraceae bacterium]|nr:16S rRNA (cytidine(1402)-2'-O)-methyltransferase [Lachnospiraceae bacterium]MBQ1721639.1 16S rRNA (cytidine(1402)-2'-O)-methyltransferase [Lachnospiraceae bacterium]MBQ2317143.1 16S rRNA (cytidine(1402)-2'-O)-methyltransferase [Lachnospiraceae bacterium]MBQ4372634.1 16S rRNA (cytidine(1402)-2'-O)-methyltransferase [Lachnospiraceae bacterium]MBQ5386895.1 16S rRNA (cytidine(1402)-2'-O)-methyltransferase [Lachnospiraceae bacterium]